LADDPHLGDIEDFALGSLQQLFGRLALIVGVAEDFGAGVMRLRMIPLSRTILA
jgi:hypothetical protein